MYTYDTFIHIHHMHVHIHVYIYIYILMYIQHNRHTHTDKHIPIIILVVSVSQDHSPTDQRHFPDVDALLDRALFGGRCLRGCAGSQLTSDRREKSS